MSTPSDITDFRTLCSRVDGMPPLWPRPPKWPFESSLRAKYAAEINFPLLLVKPVEQQRIPDMAFRHLDYLLKQHKGEQEARPACEWAAIFCGPTASCWDAGPLKTDSTPCTADEFGTRIKRHFSERGFIFASKYKVPKDPFPTFCDVCDKECTSECGCCGEIFCSRKCMRKNWAEHRRVCETVYDNEGYIDAFMTQMEMKETLTVEEMDAAFGITDPSQRTSATAEASLLSALRSMTVGTPPGNCITCDMPYAEFQCGACKDAIYCSAACRRHHWPIHKLQCKGWKDKRKKKKRGKIKGEQHESDERAEAEAEAAAEALLAEIDAEEAQKATMTKKKKKKSRGKKKSLK